jgi:hypothetical protein
LKRNYPNDFKEGLLSGIPKNYNKRNDPKLQEVWIYPEKQLKKKKSDKYKEKKQI